MRKIKGLGSISSIFGCGIALAKLGGSLLLIWLALGWKVRKARKAFEKQLTDQGMKKDDAKRVGAQYAALKDFVKDAFRQSSGTLR